MRWLLCACALALVASCNGVTGPGDGGTRPGDRLTLRVGQTVEWRGIRIGFFRIIEDSRCPRDVVCPWVGNAAAEVFIGPGGDKRGPDQVFVLNTALEPRAGEAWGARVELVNVDPIPVSTRPIPSQSYLVTLQVTESGS